MIFMNIFFPLIWFLFAASCFLLELSFPGLFYFLACSVAALLLSGITSVASQLGIFSQLLIFVLIFFISLFVLKKVVRKTETQSHAYKSHLDALIGKEGEVITEITEIVPGQVKIKNEVWLAYSVEKEVTLEQGIKVVVVGIRGVHVLVKEKK
jgi:membrane protein implicated in regulation of membrane protease activity